MGFKMPETLEGLTLEKITKLYSEAIARATELNAIPDDKITAEQSAELIELVGHVDTIATERERITAEETAAAQKLADARAAIAKAAEAEAGEGEGEGDGTEGDGTEGEGDGDGADSEGEGEGAEATAAEKEAVLASARRTSRGSFASKASRTKPEEKPEPVKPQGLSITAAANIKGFDSGSEIDGFGKLAEAYANRALSFANGGIGPRSGRKSLANVSYEGVALSDTAQRFSVATLHKPENEFDIQGKSAQESYDMIMAAARESRLPGGSLVAAGGWCAPSEQIWGFLELETADGLLSIGEVNAARGGIQFTKGPQLGELLIDPTLGFVQTEAEAEAGELKPIFDIECPDWDEVRIDAVGYALRAGLLTNSAYPELLRRYLQLATIVHARRMNKLTIDRISASIGAATAFTPVGAVPSSTADLLTSIELNAMRIREQYSMGLNATVEGVFPLWVQMVVRSDLSRRTGVELLSVTDEQIRAWFTQRKINAQFVRDYQGISNAALTTLGGTAGWTAVPNKLEYMLYPAGSYVRLGTDVIDLDTVYDTDNLTKNQFLAAFFEEGFGIANTGGSGVKVSLSLPNVFGATGYPGIGRPTA